MSRSRSEFGAVVQRSLAAARLHQFQLAQKMGVPETYVSKVLTGARKPSAAWVDLMADALEADEQRRGEMHRAAALDRGYKIDLGRL